MRILFIHNAYRQLGGEDVAVKQEMELLRAKGHSVELLNFNNEITEGGMSKLKFAISSIYNKRSYRKVRLIVETFKPDVAHVHNFFFNASPSVFFALKKMRVPVVATLHNYRLICANALLLRNNTPCELCVTKILPLSGIKYKCYHNSTVQSAVVTGISSVHKFIGTWKNLINRYILLTDFSKNVIINSALTLPNDKVTIKPNFVFDNGVGQDEREDFFLFVGRISIEKGIVTLLEAFSKHTKEKIVIVGDGPERARLEQQYQSFDNIEFAGQKSKNDVLNFMKKCKALIFPSIWYEGLPFTIIEAFSTGTPVITSRIGSMKDLVNDGFNGFLFEPGNAAQLVEILETFGNRASSHIYHNSRLTYLSKYTPDVNYEMLMTIYQQVLNTTKIKG
ncbi:glycosyltransferase family 4 protein [Pinibacter aurantiacus]|uniref:Glycosyltransferase family 4 protein n=1 Tax=Pinibacter aurantiacus TaxID=2851599 RepID=A0A9E2S7Y1_9BACT|nr:glycosyltransferase family 4 protein [Pinibacter aurantiacus]MBV4356369.1 glycosyltransferase family 4 protein [Pinibacter aurantiacus]